MALSLTRKLRSDKGQSLIELTLITPLMLFLAYGAIEVGSVISTYLTMTHTAREGANLVSRGLPPEAALKAIVRAGSTTFGASNTGQWRIIYSRIVQDPDSDCPSGDNCDYIVQPNTSEHVGQLFWPIEGGLNRQSRVGSPGASVSLPGIENVGPRQVFHSIEVFYDYSPSILTFVGRNINTDFYERAIFTDVSGG